MKKLIAAALTLTLLTALTGAVAGDAGTAADPLVTKEYADNEYTQALLSRGEETVDTALDALYDKADAIATGEGALTYTSGREAFAGTGTVTLGLGGSFILTEGTATVAYEAGEVIDTSTGQVLPSGSALLPLTRYFVTEDTKALFRTGADTAYVLDGPYALEGLAQPQYALYEDVRGSEWFAEVSRFSHDMQLFQDWDAPLYRPLDSATRAEMIYALWVTAGRPETEALTPFTDLTEDWYIPAVNWAYEHNITNGDGAADLFKPQGSLSREQIVTMLHRWSGDMGLDVSGRGDLTVFPDYESVQDWAVESVSWASFSGLIYGFEDRTFRPDTDIARAEAATILQRYIPLAGSVLTGEPDPDPDSDPAGETEQLPGGTPAEQTPPPPAD